jgi:hypothetical protein
MPATSTSKKLGSNPFDKQQEAAPNKPVDSQPIKSSLKRPAVTQKIV